MEWFYIYPDDIAQQVSLTLRSGWIPSTTHTLSLYLIEILLQIAFFDGVGWFNIKMPSYQCRKSHCGDKTVLRPSYLHNEISFIDKMASLYWIRARGVHFPCDGLIWFVWTNFLFVNTKIIFWCFYSKCHFLQRTSLKYDKCHKTSNLGCNGNVNKLGTETPHQSAWKASK